MGCHLSEFWYKSESRLNPENQQNAIFKEKDGTFNNIRDECNKVTYKGKKKTSRKVTGQP